MSLAAARPRLAVLLCSYNDAARLPRALDAILRQSRQPDELLVIDDGSTDHTPALLADYQARHPLLKVHTNPTNLGIIRCGNLGVSALDSEFVYWASANDFVLPGFFAGIMALAEKHPESGALLGQIHFEDQSDGIERLQEVRAWRESGFRTAAEFRRDYLDGEHIWFSLGPACVYRRQALADVGGFRSELGAFGDSFAVRAMGLAHGVSYLAQPCAKYFTGGESYSDRLYRNPRALLDVIGRAVWLMRSPGFHELFPSNYVERWQRDCRDAVIGHEVARFIDRQWEARRLALETGAFPTERPGPLHAAFRVAATAAHHLGRRLLTRRLRSYAPDLSCYQSPTREPR